MFSKIFIITVKMIKFRVCIFLRQLSYDQCKVQWFNTNYTYFKFRSNNTFIQYGFKKKSLFFDIIQILDRM